MSLHKRIHRFLSKGVDSIFTSRRLAIDLGETRIKLILLEKKFKKIEIVRIQIIDLHEEGLISADEWTPHLQKILEEFEGVPIALAVHQHFSISQMIDLPSEDQRNPEEQIEAKTLSLTGLSEGRIVYGYKRLNPFGKYRNPYWVTAAREDDVYKLVNRLTVYKNDICEIASESNALITAFLASHSYTTYAVLAEIGSTCTTVVIIYLNQGTFASVFPIGGETLTEAIAKENHCSFDEAEIIKHKESPAHRIEHSEQFEAVTVHWIHELENVVREWNDEISDAKTPFPAPTVYLSGGGSQQPGLPEYLETHSNHRFKLWDTKSHEDSTSSAYKYPVAYGVGLESFRKRFKSRSLMPADLRQIVSREKRLLWMNSFSLVSLLILLFLVGWNSIDKILQVTDRKTLLLETEQVLEKVHAADNLARQQREEFLKILPILKHQKDSTEVVRAIHILQELKERHPLWFVLLADKSSYLEQSTWPGQASTNLLTSQTNPPPSSLKPLDSLIVELCIPDEDLSVSKIVDEMINASYFQKVDSLPAQQRRKLVDPSRIIQDAYYSLLLDLKPNGLPKSNTETESLGSLPELQRR